MPRVIDNVFIQHQHLAESYARKIWNEENLGIERADLEQELKIRLFLAIKKYAAKWKEYRDMGGNRPIPLEFYLKTTMINKSRDIIKEINQAKFYKTSMLGYDRGVENDELVIEKLDIKIGSQKLSDIFIGEEKKIFRLLVLSDFDVKKTKKAYKGVESTDLVLTKLRTYLEENNSNVREFEVFTKEN